jgi:hypothetical protein
MKTAIAQNNSLLSNGGSMRPVLFTVTHVCIMMAWLFVTTEQAHAQWAINPAINNAICTATDVQYYPTIASDGSGGSIIAWQDRRNGANFDIYVQRIDASGVVQWTQNGVAICDVTADQKFPGIISDGAGGAIIAWNDYYGGSGDIYAQKINASGVVQWTQNGAAVCNASSPQDNCKIVSDGAGGAIISWDENRNGNIDIYAQRINASGVVQWTPGGVPICVVLSSKGYPAIISDGAGGAILTWHENRSGAGLEIYAQKINASGVVQWTPNGYAFCPATYKANPAIVSDGAGGAIIAWQDYRNGNADIFAQKILASGTTLWDPTGIEICDVVNDQYPPAIVSDGLGGAIITWRDFRSGSNQDIYAQKINASGAVQWTLNGVELCTEPNNQGDPAIIGDGAGGAMIMWEDERSGTSSDIYAQKISAAGAVQWASDGVPLGTAIKGQYDPAIVSDGAGGATAAWMDFRNVDSDIYAQKIDKYGFLGQAAPKLIAAKDVANDQGGRMRLFWDPSYLDREIGQVVTSYTIKLGTKTTGVLGKITGVTGTGIYWQSIGTVRADQSEGYSTVISTYADSGLQGTPLYYFQIIAKNSDSTQSWYSNIESGYSVDNIPPVGVGGASIVHGIAGSLKLTWDRNRVDKDLMGYVIYRSVSGGFPLNKTTILTQVLDTTYTDTTTSTGSTYYYRVAGIDVHGNVGMPSGELVQVATAVEEIIAAPRIFELSQNFPNPFNPTTTITFTVPNDGRATLRIYNTLGQEVATVFNGEAGAGRYYSVQFDASGIPSGIYFSRLEYGGETQMRKMQLIK